MKIFLISFLFAASAWACCPECKEPKGGADSATQAEHQAMAPEGQAGEGPVVAANGAAESGRGAAAEDPADRRASDCLRRCTTTLCQMKCVRDPDGAIPWEYGGAP